MTGFDPERSGTMLNDETVRGTNFACFHAGPKEGWAQFRLEPPDVPMPARGKLFLRNLLGSAGLEMSLNVVPPGKAMPFLHRHQQNDEVYVVVGGRGQQPDRIVAVGSGRGVEQSRSRSCERSAPRGIYGPFRSFA
jgi:hypothetical protein